MEIAISEANIHELKDILALSRQLGPIDISLSQAKVIYEQALSNKTLVQFTAKADGKIVGIVGLVLLPSFALQGKPIGYIQRLVVDKNFRRQGIGTKLVTHCINYARHHCYKIILHSKVQEAIRVYEKLGFKKHSQLFQIDFRKS